MTTNQTAVPRLKRKADLLPEIYARSDAARKENPHLRQIEHERRAADARIDALISDYTPTTVASLSGQERQELARLLCEDTNTLHDRHLQGRIDLLIDTARAVMLEHIEEYAKLALPEPAYYRATWYRATWYPCRLTAAVVKARGIADAQQWFEKEYEGYSMSVSFAETTEEVYEAAIIAGITTHDAT